jgi:predicted nucleic acid-binding protein
VTDCVVDASIFGPCFFDDEADEIFDGLDDLLAQGGCIAPQHWRLELTNQILVGSRRGRIPAAQASIALGQVELLPVTIDAETGRRQAEIFDLAVKHNLTSYDAAYLELAIRLGSTVASYDADLRKAALREGIAVLPT